MPILKSINTRTKITSTLITILLIAFLILNLIPVWWAISTSLKTFLEAYGWPPKWIPEHPTLYYYYKILTSRPIFHWMWNSMVLAGSVTILSVSIGTLAAYSIARFHFRGRGKVSFLVIATRFVPPMSLTVPIFIMMKSWGMYNHILSVIIVLTYLNLPFNIWLMKAFFEAVPWEIEEMGMIDGCSRLGALIRLILPISTPGVAATSIITYLGTWNEFYWPMVLTQGPEYKVIGLGIYDFMGDGMTFVNELAGGGIVMSIPAFIFIIFATKYIVSGLTQGALKGFR